MENEKIKNLLHDPNETIIGILGQSFLTSLVFDGSFQKSIMILTNKRLYVYGNSFSSSSGGNFKKSTGLNVVPTRDVTGTKYYTTRSIVLLIVGIFFILSIPSFIIQLMIVSILSIIAGILILIKYYKGKKLFIVEYPGGQIGVDMNWYSQQEMFSFQKLISIERDKIFSERS